MNRIIHQQITKRVRWLGSCSGSVSSSSSSALHGSGQDSSGVPLSCVLGYPVFRLVREKEQQSVKDISWDNRAVRDVVSYILHSVRHVITPPI